MRLLKSFLFILFAFSSSSYAYGPQMPSTLCFLNVTLVAETTYFIEKAFNQWKSDQANPAYIFCSESDINFPVTVILTGRGLAYPFSNNSKIRLSMAVPQADLSSFIDRALEVSLQQKRLFVENYYDYSQLENVEIHIENTLSEDEMKSISKSVILIKQFTENK